MTRGATIPDTRTLHIPFRSGERGERKGMQMPDWAIQLRPMGRKMVKALVHASRLKRMPESGEFLTIAELAER